MVYGIGVKMNTFEIVEPPIEPLVTLTPDYTIRFFRENEEVGCLDFSDGTLKFSGQADEAARIFFEACLKQIVDQYLQDQRKEEQVVERD